MANVNAGQTQTITPKAKKIGFFEKFRRQKYLQAMTIPGIIWLIIFCYIPMFGLMMAFQEYNPFKGFWGSPWVGFVQFQEMFIDAAFWRALVNSLSLSSIKLVFNTIMPIVFALMMNEVRIIWLKKGIQTVSYLPHFISWVIVAGIFTVWLDTRGFMADLVILFGGTPPAQGILMDPGKFYMSMAVIDLWKEMGWNSTIYMAAITGISPELYEAAIVDGAGRFRRMWNITLPSIKTTIVILLIMNVGSLLSGGLGGSNFNQSLLFGNALNREKSEVLDTYTLRMGLQLGRLSFGTAAGLLQSISSLILFSIANWAAGKISGSSLY